MKKQLLVSPDSSIDLYAPTEIELTYNDLLWVWVDSVFEISARLDVDRLRTALSKTLAVYRSACGRLRKNSAAVWKILLTDSPIPVEVVECVSASQFDDSVSQAPDAVYALHPHMGAPHEVINADLPLASLKITLSAEKTMLGLSWHHILGDGTTRLRFMSLLSRNYQGLDPLYPLPSFAREHFFDPAVEGTKPQDSFVFTRDMGATSETSSPAFTSSDPPNIGVRWTVPRTKANILRQNIEQCLGSKVSIQDCLSAYIASAVHQCSYDIQRVSCTVGFRGLSSEWSRPEVAGNLATLVPTKPLEDGDARDPCRVALKIRQAIAAAREPENAAEILRRREHFLYSCAEKGDWTGVFALSLIPHTLVTNSMASLSWQESVNFGYPKAKYYVADVLEVPFYARILPANPTAERSAGDALEVSFAVPKSMHPKIMEKLEEKNYLSPFN